MDSDTPLETKLLRAKINNIVAERYQLCNKNLLGWLEICTLNAALFCFVHGTTFWPDKNIAGRAKITWFNVTK